LGRKTRPKNANALDRPKIVGELISGISHTRTALMFLRLREIDMQRIGSTLHRDLEQSSPGYRRWESPSAGRNYRNDDAQKTMTLDADEFIRRFLLHVLPQGLQRIRYYGLLGNRREEKLRQCYSF
jgi:hypothetical protein